MADNAVTTEIDQMQYLAFISEDNIMCMRTILPSGIGAMTSVRKIIGQLQDAILY